MVTGAYIFLTRLDTLVAIDLVFYAVHVWIERQQFNLEIALKLSKIVNIYYSLWSIAWLVLCLYAWPFSEWIFDSQQLCSGVSRNSLTDVIFFGYYVSKFHEYLDIILVLLAPRKYPLHPHFRYHHLTTPFFAYLFLHHQCGHHVVFMMANLLMHAMVYAYLGGLRNRPVFWMCHVWGHLQLLLGIGTGTYSLWNRWNNSGCSCGSVWSEMIPVGLYLMYFILFQYELYWIWPPVDKKKNSKRD